MFTFQTFTKEEKDSFIHKRPGEVHLGEKAYWQIQDAEEDYLSHPDVKFVLIGFPEDVGVRGNGGIGGAGTAWIPFLKTFSNIQDTDRLRGEKFLFYGYLHSEAADQLPQTTSLDELRLKTVEIDTVLTPVVEKIIKAGKIPVAIGGGHNNALPMIRGAANAFKQPMQIVNIDAHADFRALEGRHSGNGFSYAHNESALKKYFVLGMHEAYNSRNMVEKMKNKGVGYLFWEDIFLRSKITWEKAIQSANEAIGHDLFGVEMDVDCIQQVLSSAATPVGISPREAMQALYQFGNNGNSRYLHIPEAVAERGDGQKSPFTGKTLSYLVQAFCKGVLER